MLSINYLTVLACGLIPMIVGAIYYHPKVVGTAWMNATGLTEEDVNSGNMAMIMGISFVLSCVISMAMIGFSNHQLSLQSLFIMDPSFQDSGSAMRTAFDSIMADYGDRHRSFGHGAVHGAFAGLTIAFPIIAIKSLFERRSWKYIIISVAYWLITLVLICGVASAYGLK